MLAEVCCKKGVGVHIYGRDSVVESFFVGDLWFVVFDSGKCVVECLVGGKCFVFDGLRFELVDFE